MSPWIVRRVVIARPGYRDCHDRHDSHDSQNDKNEIVINYSENRENVQPRKLTGLSFRPSDLPITQRDHPVGLLRYPEIVR
jgi:hypothetical protein